MATPSPLALEIRKMLRYSDLRFRDFMEVALYHPEYGYYNRSADPISPTGDYVTAGAISPVFAFALSKLVREFLRIVGDAPSLIVDMGCGNGALIEEIRSNLDDSLAPAVTFWGVDRSLARVPPGDRGIHYINDAARLPEGLPALVIANELFDAFPVARLVQRLDELHELWVREAADGVLEWQEHEAESAYGDYLAGHGVALEDGQFADISLDWGPAYRELAARFSTSLLVTFDYGYPADRLFRGRTRRFGTAAAYRGHRVSRDLLADPGQQDLTAHINFSDLIAAGEREQLTTLHFGRQARFLLALGITEHELFRPADEVSTDGLADAVEQMDARQAAHRLVLPDGIGDEMRVLVQARNLPATGWSFQRALA
jgi:SAM-dependent MidA family methyltransferase